MTLASVVIRTYNEERWIGTCLERIFSQEFEGDFEVIIVDSGSKDKTVEIARQFNTKIFDLPGPFIAGWAINFGIERSGGEYIVILSAHAIPIGEKWMNNLIRNFNERKVAGVYGRQIPLPDCNPLDARGLTEQFGTERKIQAKTFFFSNANSAIRRSIWREIPFDSRAKASEDQWWAKRVLERGYVIVYEPSAAVMHSHNETLRQAYRRAREQAAQMKEIAQPSGSISTLSHRIFSDWRFIIKNRYSPKWLVISPLQRFARGLGWYMGARKSGAKNANPVIRGAWWGRKRKSW